MKIHCLSALVAHLKCVEGNHHAIKHLDCEMERKVECCAKAAGVEAVICCRYALTPHSQSGLVEELIAQRVQGADCCAKAAAVTLITCCRCTLTPRSQEHAFTRNKPTQ